MTVLVEVVGEVVVTDFVTETVSVVVVREV
jgi:hypothetical protein